MSHQPAAPEMGLLMDSSSTKQRCTLFYGSKDDGPFVGQESGHVPPGLENLFPPDVGPLVTNLTGCEKLGSMESQCEGHWRTERQKPQSRSSSEEWEPGILQYSQWAGVDSRGWQIGQE